MRLAILAFLALLAGPVQVLAQGSSAGGWKLISVGGVAAQPGGRIAFSADGAVFGTTGCNRFQTTVIAAPGVVTFTGPAASTKMACQGELAEQERQVFSALEGTVAVAFDPVANRMMLIPQAGAPVLGFAWDG